MDQMFQWILTVRDETKAGFDAAAKNAEASAKSIESSAKKAKAAVDDEAKAVKNLAAETANLAKQGPPAAASIQGIAKAATNAAGAAVAYGTATAGAKAATSQMLDGLLAAKGGISGTTGALGAMNGAAKAAAKEGLRGLASEIPVVGNTLGNLIGGLGGFALGVTGLVGAGVALIMWLRSVSKEADAVNARIAQMSGGIFTQMTASMAAANETLAAANQDRFGAIEAGYKKETLLAEQAADAKIAAARAEFAKVSEFDLNYAAKKAELQAAEAAAEGELAAKSIEIRATKTAKIIELERQQNDKVIELKQQALAAESAALQGALEAQGKTYTAMMEGQRLALQQNEEAKEKEIQGLKELGFEGEKMRVARTAIDQKYSATAIQIEQQTTDKRKQIIQSLTSAALDIFSKMGKAFEQITRKLQVAQFIQQQTQAMQELKAALDAGVITQAEYTKGAAALRDSMNEARTKGVVPLTEAEKEAKVAQDELTESTKNASVAQVAAINTGNALVDSYLAQARAAIAAGSAANAAAAAQAGAGGRGGGTAAGGGGAGAGAGGGGQTYQYGNPGSYGGDMMTPGLKSSLDRVSEGLAATEAWFKPATEMGSPGGGAYSGGGPGAYQPPEGSSQAFTGSGPYDSSRLVPGGGGELTFARGGQVPGSGAHGVPIIAHPREVVGGPDQIVAAVAKAIAKRGGLGGGDVYNFNVPGKIVRLDRDWADLKEEFAAHVDSRRRRRGDY